MRARFEVASAFWPRSPLRLGGMPSELGKRLVRYSVGRLLNI